MKMLVTDPPTMIGRNDIQAFRKLGSIRMGLRISVRHALVCAASNGLGKACAMAWHSKVAACPFLSAISSGYVTGQYLLLDGGSYARTFG